MFNCLSINYKKADIEIRKKFAFSSEKQALFLKKSAEKGVEQAVILCTCNRCEVYFSDAEIYTIIELLSEFSDIASGEISSYIMYFKEQKAIKHLFRVASGIDSMVVGEDEILGQVKNAYAQSQQYRMTKYKFNMIFQNAVACAKKIKTETMLSKTSVSPATLAAKYAYEFCRKIENPKVMIIGASGKIGSIVLKNLISYGIFEITATVRKHGIEIPQNCCTKDIKTIPYEERYNFLDTTDCVISCTDSPHFTITAEKFSKSVRVQKNRLLIDLAVPPDIDKELYRISDNIQIADIDYFENLANENNRLKIQSVKSAEDLIDDSIDELYKHLDINDFFPYMDILKKESFEKIIYHLKDELSAEEFHNVVQSLIRLEEEN